MWSSNDAVALAVERAGADVMVVRVAGELNRTTAARLARLIDALARPAPGDGATRRGRYLVVDLAEVRTFGAGAIQVVRDAQACRPGSATSLHLTGLAAREAALPLRVAAELAAFSTFPTLERALSALASPPGDAARAPAIERVAHRRRRPRVADG